ncbi:MAG: hypothetical protein AVDCRST_MAG73-3008 [uncultured Thermomicrobiales bacterium]|uniref:Uncharacterized protein n=1 Tax=uncultured Thermomicrobiales bacterium TaxID=1645740 RepID=A0A6J4UKU1_9BACT|nr:MAG: hypothetical protein AVDCRST_MAG73-3008 [uncultured Thermomicrobiales bacterium]
MDRRLARPFIWLSIAAVLLIGAVAPSLAQTENPPAVDEQSTPTARDLDLTPEAGGTDDVQPAPPSIGADIPLTYFGPPPSTFQKELVGPLRLMRQGELDEDAGTMTIPLYKGQLTDGRSVWYVLTDTTDEGNANSLGLLHAPKLAYANVSGAVREATLEQDLTVTFEKGTVDFSPELVIAPGEGDKPFPPSQAEPGAVGDADYTPLMRLGNAGGHIYNAPIVAFDVEPGDISFCDGNADHSLVHDKVLAICPEEMTVTFELVPGISFARPVLYLTVDASDAMSAAIEGVTFAPALSNVRVGFDDGAFSAVERLFALTNGPSGADNPQRQGLGSALMKEGRGPLNVFGGVPTIALDYSPLWDVNIGTWTDEAIDNGYRSRMIDEFQLLGMVQEGFITGPDGAPFGSSGVIVNCPIVFRFL